MKYTVYISAHRYGRVTVEASSEEEAKKAAKGLPIDWFQEEICGTTAEKAFVP